MGQKFEEARELVISKLDAAGFALKETSIHMKDTRDDYRCIKYDDYSPFYGGLGGFCDLQPRDVSYSAVEYMFASAKSNMTHFNPEASRLAHAFRFDDREYPGRNSPIT